MNHQRLPPAPTKRLAFREMTVDDLDDMAALLADPKVMRYYPKPMNRDEARGWIEWSQHLYREHGHGLWLITLQDTGEFVGNCGLPVQNVEGSVQVEIGYLVRTDLQGNGYATEAATACRDHARDILEAKTLNSSVRCLVDLVLTDDAVVLDSLPSKLESALITPLSILASVYEEGRYLDGAPDEVAELIRALPS
ncbi:hypothetical protein GCM10009555_009980 [Acrocarpospora macrocephala]|uniref:N-acetyltransferase domain-containing protein n=1 Tax=Acrocarpospora macrocephala TaxID=150177 RepID=A0A5M3WTB4_9ACTN|nr:GNAT family N-acetyltransferase [Acrocarpospora macrocephala]GES10531.1 hypothetical protein Amac_041280 [Acrocarpospora macrocephala]